MLTELEFEEQVIKQLTEGESQWTLRDDIKSEEQIWANIRQKLEQNNVDKLDDVPLTDKEFEQVKNQLCFTSFYDAGKWLVGENGSVKVEVQREDASLGRVYLEVLHQRNIAGGSSSYEVIHQLSVPRRLPGRVDRRLDVTLLFNGLPLIHIELKKANVARSEAFNQINKYIQEDIFTGPLSMIQMFVIMNERGAEYIAAPRRGQQMNAKFLTGWLDEHNEPIQGGLNFVKEVLSIPQAHKMIADYTVLDEESKALILLRPYQIQAIEHVQAASFESKSGFVWHTTGSGKTLTSYKVARNLLKIASVDKSIFLVDRKDLDDQTFSAFNAYSENDFLEVDQSENTSNLIQQLLSEERNVIVTTRQKLDRVLKNAAEEKLPPQKVQKLRQRKLAFVVDECHRTISAEKQREIKRFFRESLWYGFTGTPIFKENKKDVKGDLEATTEDQFGPCLHQYTVKEAIHDKAVLGFKVDYKTTISEENVDVYLAMNQKDTLLALDDPCEKEKALPKACFENDQHRLIVIDEIINHSLKQFGMTQRSKSNGDYYEAILTVSSIPEAQRYYDLFQEVIRGENEQVKVGDKVKRHAPDFPKIALTYSIEENKEQSATNQMHFAQALADYNAMFGTNFDLSNVGAYNQNLNDRLARKKDRYRKREEQLDLVIVVNRLLTGFDAPCLSTLFIDRAPQKPQDIIQAFSRTNRIFDAGKTYGNIKTFRTPALFKASVDDALRLYSNGGERSVLAPSFEESAAIFREAVQALYKLAPVADQVVHDFDTKSKQQHFVRTYQDFYKAWENLKVYDQFSEEAIIAEYQLTRERREAYYMAYLTLMENLRTETEDLTEASFIELDYQLNLAHQEEINYEYIISLIQALVANEGQLSLIDQATKEEVEGYIQDLEKTKPQLAHFVREIWQGILASPYDYLNTDIRALLEDQIAEKEQAYIQDFAEKWALSSQKVKDAMIYYDTEQETSSPELKSLAKEAAQQYRTQHKDGKKTLALKREFKREFRQLVEEKIQGLA